MRMWFSNMYHLDIIDYAIFGGTLFISLALGIIFSLIGGRQRTTGEFLLGDRQMGVFPVSVSLAMSFQSAAIILTYSTELYTQGTIYVLLNTGMIMAMVLSAFVFVPVYHPMKLTSCYEYLERRFEDSKAARMLGSLVGNMSGLMYLGMSTYLPSLAIISVTGFPMWASILITAGVPTCYTALGGLKAVLWTDVFQFLVMATGVAAMFVQGLVEVGGFENMWKVNSEGGRIRFFDLDPNPTARHTLWSLSIGSCFTWMVWYCVNQASIQRVCSVKTKCEAKAAVLLNIPCILVLAIPLALNGMVVYAYYAMKKCDPIGIGYVKDAIQILPHYIVDVLDKLPGFPGLFMATSFSAAISTNSSILCALSANVWEDFLRPCCGKIQETKSALVTKLLVAIFGCTGLGIAFATMYFEAPVTQIHQLLLGASGGPLLGMFMLGIFFPWANSKGAIVGGLAGMGVGIWISVGSVFVKSYDYEMPSIPVVGCNATYLNTTLNSPIDIDLVLKNSTKLLGVLSKDKNVDTYKSAAPNIQETVMHLIQNSSHNTSNGDNDPSRHYFGLEYLYAISYLWYSLVCCIVTITVGLIVSCMTGPTRLSTITIDKLMHFAPCVSRCLRYRLRKHLYGDEEEERQEPLMLSLTRHTSPRNPRGRTRQRSFDDGGESPEVQMAMTKKAHGHYYNDSANASKTHVHSRHDEGYSTGRSQHQPFIIL